MYNIFLLIVCLDLPFWIFRYFRLYYLCILSNLFCSASIYISCSSRALSNLFIDALDGTIGSIFSVCWLSFNPIITCNGDMSVPISFLPGRLSGASLRKLCLILVVLVLSICPVLSSGWRHLNAACTALIQFSTVPFTQWEYATVKLGLILFYFTSYLTIVFLKCGRIEQDQTAYST